MIVGLHGRGNAGNVEAARYLVEYHGFTRYSLANPIRDQLLAVDPVMPAGGERLRALVADHGWTPLRNHRVIGPQLRRMMNACGSQMRETFGPDILLRSFDLWRLAEFGEDNSARIVVADVNLDAEALWLRDRGATILALSRTDTERETGHDVTDRGLHPDMIHHKIDVESAPRASVVGKNVAVKLGLERPTSGQPALRPVPNQERP